MHELIIKTSADYLLGARMDRESWDQALAEIEASEMTPMNRHDGMDEPAGNALQMTFGKWIYCAVRCLKPRVVVETGVANGASSWVILNALNKNGSGTLHSIDLPNMDTNRNYNVGTKETGWLVPESLRSRWVLRVGSSADLLPVLTQQLRPIDFFFHDSEHSRENMLFEFETVLPALADRGLVMSDDINKNSAFNEFVSENRLRAVSFGKGGAFLISSERRQ